METKVDTVLFSAALSILIGMAAFNVFLFAGLLLALFLQDWSLYSSSILVVGLYHLADYWLDKSVGRKITDS